MRKIIKDIVYPLSHDFYMKQLYDEQRNIDGETISNEKNEDFLYSSEQDSKMFESFSIRTILKDLKNPLSYDYYMKTVNKDQKERVAAIDSNEKDEDFHYSNEKFLKKQSPSRTQRSSLRCILPKSPKNAYVTVIYDENTVENAICLLLSLRRCNVQFPVICLIDDRFGIRKHKNHLKMYFDYVIEVERINYNRYLSLTKWRCFDLIKYDKIVFLDTDCIVFQNLDHLFESVHTRICPAREIETDFLDWNRDEIMDVFKKDLQSLHGMFRVHLMVLFPDKNIISELLNITFNNGNAAKMLKSVYNQRGLKMKIDCDHLIFNVMEKLKIPIEFLDKSYCSSTLDESDVKVLTYKGIISKIWTIDEVSCEHPLISLWESIRSRGFVTLKKKNV